MATHFYIDPIAIANSYGIKVEPYREAVPDDLCGEIEKTDKGVVIRYNPTHHPNRQRFTIAHELGHYVLGHLNGNHKKFRDPLKNFNVMGFDWEEVEANNYAANLLMPKDKIDFLIFTKGISDIEQMAALLRVSPAAMTYRLKNLGYIS